MSSAERKERHKSDLREKILHVSEAIVVNEGLSALTIRRVADRIDYSPAAIYLYFKNREEIVRELGRTGLELLLQTLDRGAASRSPRKRLLAMAQDYVKFAVTHPDTYRLIFMANSDTAEAIFRGKGDEKSNIGERAFQAIVDVFSKLAEKEKAYASLDVTGSAEIYWTSLHGIASLKITCPMFLETPAETLVEANVGALLGGLKTGR